jgi:CubicO group peptidase (beta-lactamase class C family)
LVASLGSARAAEPATARAIASVARTAFVADHLKALLVRVDVDGKPIYAEAFGESMSGVPATTSMHFRNGAMAFAYMATTIVELADRGKLKLSDHLSKYFPQLPHATKITLRNLANMTSGYADYVYQPEVLEGTVLDPFRQYTPDELIHIGTSKPMAFAPGTNWGYSHTNYIILGRVIEKVTGLPLATALQRYIMTPMHLTQTKSIATPEIPEPVLHTFSSERREELGVKASAPFYEEATYWNPSWTTIEGAVQVTDLADWTRSMELIQSLVRWCRRTATDRLRPSTNGLRGMPQVDGRLQLRARRRARRALDGAKQILCRDRRQRRLPAFAANCDFRRCNVPARRVRRSRECGFRNPEDLRATGRRHGTGYAAGAVALIRRGIAT